MTPSIDDSLDQVVTTEQKPSLTWQLDLQSGRIKGLIDGKAAIYQAAEKIVLTERYAYRIYSWNYGCELAFYVGKDTDFVLADAERTITEALTQDDRITGIEDFKASFIEKDSVLVTFTIVSTAGKFNYEKEISLI